MMRDYIRQSLPQHTGKIVGEKVIKYFEERLKSRVSNGYTIDY